MAGPVEEKPFEITVAAELLGHRQWMLRYIDGGASVLSLTGDADRVEEVVRLINASVIGAQTAPQAESEAQPNHAFPQAVSYKDRSVATGGLTKREWFAGQAIVGLYQFISEINSGNDLEPVALARITSEVAFQIADAMLAQRAKAVRS